jgi:hypothetical protein
MVNHINRGSNSRCLNGDGVVIQSFYTVKSIFAIRHQSNALGLKQIVDDRDKKESVETWKVKGNSTMTFKALIES